MFGKSKAAEMAYQKLLAIKAKHYRDFNPSDDFGIEDIKGLGSKRIKARNQQLKQDKQQEELLRMAKMSNSIEQGFKNGNATTTT